MVNTRIMLSAPFMSDISSSVKPSLRLLQETDRRMANIIAVALKALAGEFLWV